MHGLQATPPMARAAQLFEGRSARPPRGASSALRVARDAEARRQLHGPSQLLLGTAATAAERGADCSGWPTPVPTSACTGARPGLALRRHQHRVTLSAPPTERVTRVTFISNAWCSTRDPPGTAGTEASVTAINDDDMTERKDLSRRRHRHHHQRSHCEAAQCPRSCCECTGRGWCPCERAPWSYGPGGVRGHSPHSAL